MFFILEYLTENFVMKNLVVLLIHFSVKGQLQSC